MRGIPVCNNHPCLQQPERILAVISPAFDVTTNGKKEEK
jgi:hypothetical protein